MQVQGGNTMNKKKRKNDTVKINMSSPRIKLGPAVNVYMTEDDTLAMAGAPINEELRKYAREVNK